MVGGGNSRGRRCPPKKYTVRQGLIFPSRDVCVALLSHCKLRAEHQRLVKKVINPKITPGALASVTGQSRFGFLNNP